MEHVLVGDALGAQQQRQELIEALRQFRRQALHAARLGLEHPDSGEYCEWTAPLPEDFSAILDVLRQDLAHA